MPLWSNDNMNFYDLSSLEKKKTRPTWTVILVWVIFKFQTGSGRVIMNTHFMYFRIRSHRGVHFYDTPICWNYVSSLSSWMNQNFMKAQSFKGKFENLLSCARPESCEAEYANFLLRAVVPFLFLLCSPRGCWTLTVKEWKLWTRGQMLPRKKKGNKILFEAGE